MLWGGGVLGEVVLIKVFRTIFIFSVVADGDVLDQLKSE